MKKFLGKTLKAKVTSLHMGNNEDLSKQSRASLVAEIGGFDGDKHQGPVPIWVRRLQQSIPPAQVNH